MIFADTGALFAVIVKSDENHSRARSWLKVEKRRSRLLTTDYVIDELLTLLKVRGELGRAHITAKALLKDRLAHIHYISQGDLSRGAQVFDQFTDKEWSFTDCVSYAVLEHLKIEKAFSFDVHFKQFGLVEVVP